jgi:hypothetical protein
MEGGWQADGSLPSELVLASMRQKNWPGTCAPGQLAVS